MKLVGMSYQRIVLIGAVTGLLLGVPSMLDGGDVLSFLVDFFLLPAVAITAVIATAILLRRRQWSGLLLLPVLAVFTWGSLRSAYTVHDQIRWWCVGPRYRAAVLAQPVSAGNSLRHVEWDGSGFAGMETIVYLVYAPDVSKGLNLPCPVADIRKRGEHWAEVTFYTEEAWDFCGPAAEKGYEPTKK